MTSFLFNMPERNSEKNFIYNTNNKLSDPKLLKAQIILDICIFIIVAAIPELPLAVILSLAFQLKNDGL